MLSKGGALAMIGNLDPSHWAVITNPQIQRTSFYPFERLLIQILEGAPVGYAFGGFADALDPHMIGSLEYIETTLRKAGQMDSDRKSLSSLEFSKIFVKNHDVNNWVVFGDPAVHLNLNHSY
jgi:hypothetical protein